MNPADIRTQLREAVRLHRAGDTDAARNIIRGVLREHPDNADAWYAASMIATGAAQRKKMLERALEHNPDHKAARTALDKLAGQRGASGQQPGGSGGRGRLLLIGIGTLVVAAAIVVGIVLLAGSPPEPEVELEDVTIELPTLAPTFTPTLTETVGPTPTPVPTDTPKPTATLTSTVTPTATATSPPFGQTATMQLFDSQTEQGILYELGTAAAGP